MKRLLLILCNFLLFLNVTAYAQPRKVIENEFDICCSHDNFYWFSANDSSRYVMVKTPLKMLDTWDKIIAPFQKMDALSKYPFFHDKDFWAFYYLVDNRLFLTGVNTLDDSVREAALQHLDSLLPEKFTHEYDNYLNANHTYLSSKGAMLVTWVDSLDIRNFQTYKQHRPEETTDGFFNRLDVHPYLRLYFKEGVLTNIKFITPRVKEE